MSAPATPAPPAPGDERARRIPARLRRARDRFVAADPGMVRLRTAGRSVVAIGTAMLVEFLVAHLMGLPSAMVPMMLGGVVAILATLGVLDATRRGQALTLCLLPPFLLAGSLVAVLVDANRLLSLAMFVVVAFVAVWLRRFGLRYFGAGMAGFMGYFFALFLNMHIAQLGGVAIAVVVAVVWVMVLSLLLMPVRNHRVLARMLRSFEARISGVAGTVLRIMDAEPGSTEHDRATARLRSLLARLNECALVIDGQLGAPDAVTGDEAARTVRRSVFDAELVAAALTRTVPAAAITSPEEAREVLTALRAGRWDDLTRHAERLAGSRPGDAPAGLQRLAADALLLTQARGEWTAAASGGAEEGEDGFVPAVQLFGGGLPGSAGTVMKIHQPPAESAAAEDGEQVPEQPKGPLRISLTTRQAVQVAAATTVAIVVGDALSEQRYYWAVLAAFLAFAGTSTVAETLRKAAHRIGGTMLGLLLAIPLVPLLGTSPQVVLPVVLISIFGAIYFFKLYYSLMIFFLTLLLGELYALLGSFTPDLMVLRLEETIVGGLAGCLASALILPTRTRVAADAARRGLLTALAGLLQGVDHALRRPAEPRDDLRAAARALDAALYQALLLGRPLSRTRTGVTDPDNVRRLTTLTALAEHARRLARATERIGVAGSGPGAAVLTAACSRLEQLLTDAAAGRRPPEGSYTAVVELVVTLAGARDPLAPLAREAGLVAAELESLLGLVTPAGSEPEAGATASGRVRGPDGLPAAATVTLVDRAGRQLDRAVTDAGGHFAVAPPEAGTHLLVVAPAEPGAAPFGEYLEIAPRAVLPDVVLGARTARPAPAPVAGPGPGTHTGGAGRPAGLPCHGHR
ncbi:FUSC family protein [Pseudonocardia phyllosphaerae]|uniref:FUSC family protein n=1 Tax=Pseudonocardia phyllosphaerae TaxID=3390502 RepID=UPI00397D0D21